MDVRLIAPALVIAAALLGACDDFATPADLSRTQILAIRAAQPAVAPGASTELEVLIADADGELADPQVQWEVVASDPTQPRLGSIERVDGRVLYRAPAAVAETPAFATIQATFAAQSQELVALKVVAIGELPLTNPTITSITADGEVLADDAGLEVEAGSSTALMVDVESSADDLSYAWYVTAGEIERYIFNPATLVIADDAPAKDAWLFVVVRDGRGGVGWRKVPLRVR